MKTELLKSHNSVNELGNLQPSAYENIFNMYKDEDQFFAYNILKTVQFPHNMGEDYFYYHRTTGSDPWTKLSFDHYGTIKLWWLVCLVNKIMNPVIKPAAGTVLRILKPLYIADVINQLKRSG